MEFRTVVISERNTRDPSGVLEIVYISFGMSGGYKGVYMCKNSSSCTLKIYALLHLKE